MKRLVGSLILAVLLVAPLADANAAGPSVEGWIVRRPGLVLLDPAKRRADLATVSTEERNRLCPGPASTTELPAPFARLTGPGVLAGDPASQPFSALLMDAAAADLAGSDEKAERGVKLLERWARAGGFNDLTDVGPDRSNTTTLYSLRRTLLGVLPAWAILRGRTDRTPEIRDMIDRWIARRVADADQPTGPLATRYGEGSQSNRNEQRLMREALIMGFAALTGDSELFRRGPAFYLATLKDMRPDGSLPLETVRGPRALWYQRHAVTSMVYMAELARTQGYDLYSVDVDGKRLDRAVGFLLAAISDKSLIGTYAPETQDMGFLEPTANGRHLMAWLEPWQRRQPMTPFATGDLLAGAFAHRPLIDELSGGNLTCYYAKLG